MKENVTDYMCKGSLAPSQRGRLLSQNQGNFVWMYIWLKITPFRKPEDLVASILEERLKETY